MAIRRRPVNSAGANLKVTANQGGEEQYDQDARSISTASINHQLTDNAPTPLPSPPEPSDPLDPPSPTAPPTYTLSALPTETALEAESYVPEKSQRPLQPSVSDEPTPGTTRCSTPAPGPRVPAPDYSASLPSGHFTRLTDDAALAYVRRCTLLSDRPAVWLVKRRNCALSALAATILTKEGLLGGKDVVLITAHSGAKRDPTDPLSAVAFGVYDTVGGVMSGLIAAPTEAYRQVTPMLKSYEERQSGLNTKDANSHANAPETGPLNPYSSTPAYPPEKVAPASTAPESASASAFTSESASTTATPESTHKADHKGPAHIAIEGGKGLGKIVGSGLKAPMTFTHGMARGFHNLPKLYGEEVREYENITNIRSGLAVSGKSFGHGLTDGLKDFFVKPVEGAQKEGVLGFAKGFGKGVGNLVCKPSAGAIGLVGYSFVGVYKEVSNINLSGKDDAGDIVRYQGEREFEAASKELRLDVVKRWYQVLAKK